MSLAKILGPVDPEVCAAIRAAIERLPQTDDASEINYRIALAAILSAAETNREPVSVNDMVARGCYGGYVRSSLRAWRNLNEVTRALGTNARPQSVDTLLAVR